MDQQTLRTTFGTPHKGRSEDTTSTGHRFRPLNPIRAVIFWPIGKHQYSCPPLSGGSGDSRRFGWGIIVQLPIGIGFGEYLRHLRGRDLGNHDDALAQGHHGRLGEIPYP